MNMLFTAAEAMVYNTGSWTVIRRMCFFHPPAKTKT